MKYVLSLIFVLSSPAFAITSYERANPNGDQGETGLEDCCHANLILRERSRQQGQNKKDIELAAIAAGHVKQKDSSGNSKVTD